MWFVGVRINELLLYHIWRIGFQYKVIVRSSFTQKIFASIAHNTSVHLSSTGSSLIITIHAYVKRSYNFLRINCILINKPYLGLSLVIWLIILKTKGPRYVTLRYTSLVLRLIQMLFEHRLSLLTNQCLIVLILIEKRISKRIWTILMLFFVEIWLCTCFLGEIGQSVFGIFINGVKSLWGVCLFGAFLVQSCVYCVAVSLIQWWGSGAFMSFAIVIREP